MAEQEPRVKLPPVEQIGIVVNDIDRAIQYYTSVFGLGPFRVREFENKGAIYKGQPSNNRSKVAFARSGSIEIELIQVLDGESPATEFLREKGEGIQHLCFGVDDLEETLAELTKDGINTMYRMSSQEYGTDIAFINSNDVGGVMFELYQRPHKPKT
ncbi:VOC family protein [Chloroflexota bacterium]